jgi:hypothetical protein
MVTIKRAHKSVLLIGLLPLEKTSFDLVVSHGKSLFTENIHKYMYKMYYVKVLGNPSDDNFGPFLLNLF